MDLPEEMILLEPRDCTAQEILDQGANDPTAVNRYLDCLSRGWIGQALIEKYTYHYFPDTADDEPAPIPEGVFAEYTADKRDQLLDDWGELLAGGHDESIKLERDIYAKAMENADDPGRHILKELVERADERLENWPHIIVEILDVQRRLLGSRIEVKWRYGLEDTITRLSAKVLDDEVVGMAIDKSGLDFVITFQVAGAERELALEAMIEEIKHWN